MATKKTYKVKVESKTSTKNGSTVRFTMNESEVATPPGQAPIKRADLVINMGFKDAKAADDFAIDSVKTITIE